MTRIADPGVAQSIVDVFTDKYGYKEIDSARLYGAGNSEKVSILHDK